MLWLLDCEADCLVMAKNDKCLLKEELTTGSVFLFICRDGSEFNMNVYGSNRITDLERALSAIYSNLCQSRKSSTIASPAVGCSA